MLSLKRRWETLVDTMASWIGDALADGSSSSGSSARTSEAGQAASSSSQLQHKQGSASPLQSGGVDDAVAGLMGCWELGILPTSNAGSSSAVAAALQGVTQDVARSGSPWLPSPVGAVVEQV